jgi:hypothetical protein
VKARGHKDFINTVPRISTVPTPATGLDSSQRGLKNRDTAKPMANAPITKKQDADA